MILWITLFVFGHSLAQGKIDLQDKAFQYTLHVDSVVWQQLRDQLDFVRLQEEDRMFFYWTNILRKDPRQFWEVYVAAFLQQFPEANTREAKSLESDLKSTASLPLLWPDSGLQQMAIAHANDLAKRNGIISHYSSTGKGFVERLKNYGRYRCGAENLYAGTPDPLEALIVLLLDHGVANQGHRKNLLDPLFTHMGAHFTPMGPKKAVLVQTFGCK